MTNDIILNNLAFSWQYFSWAAAIGAISALSLPLGTLVGLTIKPTKNTTGALAAYGSGALLAALCVELISPTIHLLTQNDNRYGDPQFNFILMIIGALAGGFIFICLEAIIDDMGGFLRKTSTLLSYFRKEKIKKNKELIYKLAKVDILRHVSEEHVQELIDLTKEHHFSRGQTLFKQGDQGDHVYFIKSGTVQLIKNKKIIASAIDGTTLGEIALITDQPRTADAIALTDVTTWALSRHDFYKLRKKSTELDIAAKKLTVERLKQNKDNDIEQEKHIDEWSKKAIEHSHIQSHLPNKHELKKTREKHSNANMAIWMGITLDGIPESFVIGTGFFALLLTKGSHIHFYDLIPYTLIAGLFLSNFPEALSSSVGMKKQGYSTIKIFSMWFSLVILTAIGSGLGYALSDHISHSWIISIEGLAAGAMLTMIASTMIPEAVYLCGRKTVGISTLIGFLSAISFKLLE